MWTGEVIKKPVPAFGKEIEVSFFLAIRGPIDRLPLVDWLRTYDAAECQSYMKRTLKQLLPGNTGAWVIGSGAGDDCQDLVDQLSWTWLEVQPPSTQFWGSWWLGQQN